MAEGGCVDEAFLHRIRRRRSDGFLIRLIDLLLREAPSRIEEAWQAGRSGDSRRVATAVHTLDCLAGNVGAVAVRSLAAEALQAAAGGRRGAARLPRILFDLEVAWAETRSCLLCAKREFSA